MVTNFRVKIGEIGLFTFIRHSETDCSIAILISKGSSAMIWLHVVSFGLVTPGV